MTPGRSVPEWIGETTDTRIPHRVRLRVFERFNRCCAECSRKIFIGDIWICDHVLALVNGGENREGNLQPLCAWCAADKFKDDIRIKRKTSATIAANYTPRMRKKWPPIPGSKRSRYHKRMDGTVERR